MVSNPDSSLSQREADDAIRVTNTQPDTLIGKRMATVASAVYGSRAYLAEWAHRQREPQWIGVEARCVACEIAQRFKSLIEAGPSVLICLSPNTTIPSSYLRAITRRILRARIRT
jgi:hypothetical protein